MKRCIASRYANSWPTHYHLRRHRGKKEASIAAVHNVIVAELSMTCGLGSTRRGYRQGAYLHEISDPEELPAYELLRAIVPTRNRDFEM